MFTFLKKYYNIVSFDIFNNKPLLNQRNRVLLDSTLVFESDIEVSSQIIDGILIYYADLRSGWLEYLGSKYKLPSNYYGLYIDSFNLKDNSLIISLNRRKNKENIRVGDFYKFYFIENKLENLSSLLPVDVLYFPFKEGSFIYFDGYDRKKIILYKLGGTPLWHFPLSTLNDLYPEIEANWEVWHFAGVVEGVLWVCIDSNKGQGALLGLDADTGTPLHFLHHAQDQTKGAMPTMPANANTQYDPQANKLIGFGNYHYWEVDLNQEPYQPKIWNLEEELRALRISLAPGRVNAMNGNYIFSFSGALQPILDSSVFALNRKTLQIDWRYVFDMEEKGYFTPMKVEITDTHLFVLDSQGTLHIFEKEG